MTAPAEISLMLRQGEGSPCRPVVKEGDAVRAGQRVAAGSADGAAELHSSIEGTVVGVEEVAGTDGTGCPALVIRAGVAAAENEPSAEAAERVDAEPEVDADPLKRTADELLERIRRAGVVQGGRDGRSLATVIGEARAPRGFIEATAASIVKPLERLVIRFCDVDPHLGSVAAAAESIGDDTVDFELGARVLARVTDAANVHLVLDKRQAFAAVEQLAEQSDWTVHRVDSQRYPLAAEPFLVQTVSGREPPTSFRRFHESGTLVVDVGTLLEVTRAVRDGLPVVDRLLTVLGPTGRKVLRVHLGTSLAEVVSESGNDAEHGKVVVGGPLSGLAHHTLDYPVSKTTAGITLFPRDGIADFENQPCISCGLCAMVCPTRLVPGMLSRYCEFGQFEQAETAHLFSCVECGCCAYVCPAGRSMVQFLIHGKTEIAAARRAS
jgi:electron transport complex protein RnfC